MKVLKLEKSDTLENYVMVRDDRKKVFKYATISGSLKNLKEFWQDQQKQRNSWIIMYCFKNVYFLTINMRS